uniref:Uncharacterized protein n=1 Tax=Romanomermis culicivorax TaxID=13658 RepID=A0A915KD47_ROMCU
MTGQVIVEKLEHVLQSNKEISLEEPGAVFNFQEELIKYSNSNVDVLLKASRKLRELFDPCTNEGPKFKIFPAQIVEPDGNLILIIWSKGPEAQVPCLLIPSTGRPRDPASVLSHKL